MIFEEFLINPNAKVFVYHDSSNISANFTGDDEVIQINIFGSEEKQHLKLIYVYTV